MMVNVITSVSKKQMFIKNYLVEGIPERVEKLREWAEYFIADGEEDNIKDVTVRGFEPNVQTVVPYDGKNPTCNTVSSLIDANTHEVAINCLDGNVITATVCVFKERPPEYRCVNGNWTDLTKGLWEECTPWENK